MSEAERKVLSDESMAYCDALVKQGEMLSASPLHPVETATTVRVRSGKVSNDRRALRRRRRNNWRLFAD